MNTHDKILVLYGAKGQLDGLHRRLEDTSLVCDNKKSEKFEKVKIKKKPRINHMATTLLAAYYYPVGGNY